MESPRIETCLIYKQFMQLVGKSAKDENSQGKINLEEQMKTVLEYKTLGSEKLQKDILSKKDRKQKQKHLRLFRQRFLPVCQETI